jgi:TolB-like protein/Flp pilus assembly protein TadD
MASVWGELKRRNVVRVAIAYAIVAWLLIEVSVTTFPILNLPDWAATLVTVLLLLGFPVALIFAWAFELTPDGLKKEKDVDRAESISHITGRKLDFIIIGVLVVAVGFLLVDKIYLSDGDTAPDEIIATERHSIAVLPFVNMSPDPDQEYFSDGLSEEILNLLAKIPELKVIGRTSSFVFKGKNEDLRIIGEALGVTTLLEGSVRKSGDRVRITAQLVNALDGAHIWSETYDRTMTDIFAVQDEVAAAVIDALQIHVGANPTRGRPTENTAAYAQFLKARASLNAFELRDAEGLLLEVVRLDPNFAQAYELLSYCYWQMGGSVVKAAEAQKLAFKAASNALAVDPDLVFAQAMYQSATWESDSWALEIQALERAAREQPSNLATLAALGFDLVEAGYLREAVEVAERSVELDPLSPAANLFLGNALYAAGRISEALAVLEVADQLGSEFAKAAIGRINLVERRDDIAIAYFEDMLQQQDNLDSSWVRDLVTGGRDPTTGQAYLDRRIPEIIASVPEEAAFKLQQELLTWYLHFGFLDRQFEVILELQTPESKWADAGVLVFQSTVHRRLGFTAHPKYLEVVKLLGVIELWEQRGPPDFCEKLDAEWDCA